MIEIVLIMSKIIFNRFNSEKKTKTKKYCFSSRLKWYLINNKGNQKAAWLWKQNLNHNYFGQYWDHNYLTQLLVGFGNIMYVMNLKNVIFLNVKI